MYPPSASTMVIAFDPGRTACLHVSDGVMRLHRPGAQCSSSDEWDMKLVLNCSSRFRMINLLPMTGLKWLPVRTRIFSAYEFY